ncbi:MAG TPA: peptidylprolyl isomerase [Nocardioides sp.]|uniref:peptidylprolyl isomerase n=1 Tax=Nocardioides sp. TaxID=35761 RepID=UPI002CF298C2|nr:peptidylprolyl isomerase [Nocardioides sp.]HQR28493.1 peptidylprolyl isomerase [Nocardioides sp.]
MPVTIQTTQGDLHATLDADAAPCTVNSFLSLAEQGYYDDTPCHRLTTGGFYILQCGDPTGTGTGGPGYRFADELSGSERYPAGTLAMANNGADTNGSQFFVVYGDTPIGPQYTVFGRVDDAAVRTLTTIARAGTDNSFGPGDGHPKKAVTITSVTVD